MAWSNCCSHPRGPLTRHRIPQQQMLWRSPRPNSFLSPRLQVPRYSGRLFISTGTTGFRSGTDHGGYQGKRCSLRAPPGLIICHMIHSYSARLNHYDRRLQRHMIRLHTSHLWSLRIVIVPTKATNRLIGSFCRVPVP